MSQPTRIPSPPPALDPPFRGYIETTFDSLLVFEAARRGMIPRVTRRLIDRERGMVQSGAVFVFDEHESGIKRWTDGLVWSPSRILGNFLVYRETDKRQGAAPAPMSTAQPVQPSTSSSPNSGSSPSAAPAYLPYDAASSSGPALGHGQLNRPRRTSDGGTLFDRQKERQLVGSLTSSYKFKEGGLVKKTMSVTVNGFSQHMISYYSVEDVLAGKLRSPSTIPELASLEISPEYLSKQNFRFPPQIEVGHDGIPRYRGEPEEPASPPSQSHTTLPNTMMTYAQPQEAPVYDSYGNPMQSSPAVRSRSTTGPILIPAAPSHGSNYMSPGTHTNGGYIDHGQMPMGQPGPPPIIRQNSTSSIQSQSSSSGAIRPSSSHRRYDPYGDSHGSGSPRSSSFHHQPHHLRRPSMQPGSQSSSEMYVPSPYTAPGTLPGSYHSYHYQPPATAPSAYNEFYSPMPPRSAQNQPHGVPSPLSPNPAMLPYPQSQPYNWPRGAQPSNEVIPGPPGVEFGGPPSSSGSSGAGSGGSGIMTLSASAQRPGPHSTANGHDPLQLPQSWAPPPVSSLWNGSVDASGIPVRNQMEIFGSPQQAAWPRPGQETRI